MRALIKLSQILQLLPPFCGGCAAQYWGRRRAICTVLPCKIARRRAIFPNFFPAIFRKFSPRAARRRAALWAGKKIAGKKNSYAILCAVRPANCEALPAKLGGRPRKFGGVSPQPGGNNRKISDIILRIILPLQRPLCAAGLRARAHDRAAAAPCNVTCHLRMPPQHGVMRCLSGGVAHHELRLRM